MLFTIYNKIERVFLYFILNFKLILIVNLILNFIKK